MGSLFQSGGVIQVLSKSVRKYKSGIRRIQSFMLSQKTLEYVIVDIIPVFTIKICDLVTERTFKPSILCEVFSLTS